MHSPSYIKSIICMTDKLFCNRKSFVWSNYYVLEKLWKQKSRHKWKLEGDNQVWWTCFLTLILKGQEKS